MGRLSIAFSLLVFIQLVTFGQMLKFPKQDPDLIYKASFLLSNQNNQLFYWIYRDQLLQSKSTDGINWSDTAVVEDYISTTGAEITGIVLNSGRIYLVYKNSYFYSIYSDDNGQRWSVPAILPTGSKTINYRYAHYGSLCQTSTGKLNLVYSQDLSGINYLRFISSSDTGKTWGTEQTFATDSLIGTISAMSNNKLILVYQNHGLFSSFSTNDGVSWDNGISILNDTLVNNPKVVKDQTGKLWLFYQRIVPTPFQRISQQDIMYKTSIDNGLTWGAENNFTRYKGFDGYFNVSPKGNNPLISFSSDRKDSANTIYNLWYGTAGLTNDDNAPPCVYKYAVSNPTPQPGEQFNIAVYLGYFNNAPIVSLNRTISGNVQPPLTMYDDGTHGDTLANDKIFTCEVPGLVLGDGMRTEFNITDNLSGSFVYKGPIIVIPYTNSVNSTIIDVNRFKLPLDNKGTLADVLVSPDIFPGGKYDGNITLFSGGYYLTGKSNGNLWSNVNFSSRYIFDYVPGKVGTNPEDPKNILYVVKSTDLPFGQSWQDWKIAVSQGASFYDGNRDGIYNPTDLNSNGKWDSDEDRPDLLGDMTAWCVYNDGVPSTQRVFNGVNPQGIEIQQTVFAQKDSADLNNVVFVRYKIINRGTIADVIDSVYFGSVNDADIGVSGANDLAGCDTLLNSVYTYHKIGAGDNKWGNNPPAETLTLLQGPLSYIPGVTFTDINNNGMYDPVTDIPIDTGYSFGGPLIGKTIYPGAKNLNMTSTNQYFKNSEPQNSIQAQYTLMGRHMQDGSLYDPCTWSAGQVLGGVNCADVNPMFMYSGDPATQIGWINSIPLDQRNLLSTGPFKLEKNKPIDILIANLVGRGSDYLNSITIAKNYAANIIKYYNLNFPNSILTGIRDLPQVINNFNLFQNYPNPFNPSTRIKFSVSTNSLVSIKVYNILGKEVALLLNEQKHPGEYEITFNSGMYNLASGVYFYKLSAGGFTSVKKMVLIK
jgi:hypothetical protein